MKRKVNVQYLFQLPAFIRVSTKYMNKFNNDLNVRRTNQFKLWIFVLQQKMERKIVFAEPDIFLTNAQFARKSILYLTKYIK